MSILVEIAERADVSVEGVVRVLTREPVGDAVKERVLAVLDDLGPEQTRAVQRFALAALHDILERPGEAAGEDPGEQLALPAAAEDTPGPDRLPATASDAALVQLSSVLGELAEAVRDLRTETDAERRERVDDLAVLIDLITTGWQGLNTRLGRLERQLSRLEGGRRTPLPVPMRIPQPVAEPAPPAEAVPEPAVEPEPAPTGSLRDRLPLTAALAVVGVVAATLAILQIAAGGPDVERLVSTGPGPATTEAGTGASSTTAPPPTTPVTTSTRPPAAKPPAPATTSSVLGTTAPKAKTGPPSVTTSPATTAPAPRLPAPTASAPTSTAPVPAQPSQPTGFRPTRSWAWAPVQDADYYSVEFTRGGEPFYRASPTEPRLTLPSSVVFLPGSYRWRVVPGFGARSANRLGDPVVDSTFIVPAS